jgi:hypothetical protein
MVKHVQYVAIFMLVEGALELLPGGVLTAFGVATAFGIARGSELRGDIIPPELTFVVFFLGPALFGAGVFKVLAGLRNLKMRDRTMGLIALGSSFIALPTCYCAPTALALAIYGFIVYLNDDVQREFARAEAARRT